VGGIPFSPILIFFFFFNFNFLNSVNALCAPNYTVAMQAKLFSTAASKVADLVFCVFLQSGTPDESVPFSSKDSYTCVSINMYKKMVPFLLLLLLPLSYSSFLFLPFYFYYIFELK
jgi:hypothetical protein